jgi:hypothetical protein
MKRGNAGGGMGSRQVKSSNAARKVEPRAQGIRPGAVAQIGSALGNHATDGGGKILAKAVIPARTPGYNAPVGANVNAKPTVHPSGGQHSLAEPKPMAAGRPVVLEPGRP